MTALPEPARKRWQPLRAGLVELFHYTATEFWFRDGRLLLRGNNGTGKSKVLALTLPFLLDGDTRGSRVEPDGEPHKRMDWNLLLGGRHGDRLGYSWLELGRLDDDEPRYTTLLCGLRATAGSSGTRTWFAVTDQRVGQDLHLVGDDRIVKTRERLAEAVGDRGEVIDTATAYRAAVDRALFGLGPERYTALVELLLALRQPQLSKRPDEAHLSRALSDALPPLGERLLADTADAFRGLEDDRSQLDNYMAAARAAERFEAEYRTYAGIAARRRAKHVASAQYRYEKAARERAEATEAVAAAEQSLAELDHTLAEARTGVATERQREEALRDSPAMRDAESLRSAAEAAQRASDEAGRERSRLAEDADRLRRAVAAVADAETESQRSGAARDAAAGDLAGAAAEAGIGDEVDAAIARLDAGLDDTRRTVRHEMERRGQALAVVRELVAKAEDVESLAHAARRRADEATQAADAAGDRLAEAEQSRQAAGAALVASAREWLGGLRELSVPHVEELLDVLGGWVLSLDGPDPFAAAVGGAHEAASARLGAEAERLDAARRERVTQIEGREAEQAALLRGEDRLPEAPHTRAADARRGRPGAPLWRLVDFVESLADGDRAGLEAALEASGLLDAWVTPDGSLLDPGTHDLVVTAGRPVQRHLGAVLRPAIDRSDPQAAAVPDAAVAVVLAGIGLGPATGESWIGADGRWRLGVAEGAWAKPAAEFVGAGARAAARRRRLEVLERELTGLRAEVAGLDDARQRLDDRRTRLSQEAASRPDSAFLHDAAATVAAVRDELRRLREERERLDGHAAELLDRQREAETAREEAAAQLRLPATARDLGIVRDALARCRETGAALWPLADSALAAADRLDDAAVRRTEAEQRVTATTAQADGADARAQQARTRHQTLAESVGAAVAELEERLAAARRERERLERRLEQLGTQQHEETLRLGEARGEERERARRLDEDAAARVEAARAFQRFAAGGLLSAALPELALPALDDEWAPDPTVRLARQVEQALVSAVDADDAAWDRAQKAISGHVADLTDAMSAQGHTVTAQPSDEGLAVSIVFLGSEVTPTALVATLRREVADRGRLLDARERDIISKHLVDEIAAHLGELLDAAESRTSQMNDELSARPTSTGMKLRLRWLPAADAPEGLAEARRRLLRQTVDAWSPDDRAAVADFLKSRIDEVRATSEGTWHEHLTAALDYRRWHRFAIERWQDGAWRRASGPSSGGERVLAATVPLFAAARASYSGAAPHAPTLVMLDEAFAGVDDDSRRKCFGLLAAFDLDVVMTSEREWGCYREVPGLGIAHLSRFDGIDAVHVSRWEWDGRDLHEVPEPTTTLYEPAPDATGMLHAST